ncbi:MAG: low affinity iron permease family protein [Anaerolineae bacterium]|nr:low affinity iron permease family protein [Anaerolineae bacterium]
MNEYFHKFAQGVSVIVGSAWSFTVAVVVILLWAMTGPIFNFSDTWQLIINTGTTIITFLMVFLIQNTQNRDAKAIHLKLDELLRGIKGARTGLVDLEELSDEELEQLQQEFRRLRERYQKSASVAEEGEQAAKKEKETDQKPAKRKEKKNSGARVTRQKTISKQSTSKNGTQESKA